MMKKFVLIATVLLSTQHALAVTAVRGEAQTTHPSKTICFNPSGSTSGAACSSTPILDDVALNASASDRTVEIDLDKLCSKLLVTVELSRTAATDLTVTPTMKLNDSSGAVPIKSGAISEGTRTLYTFTDTSGTISADYDGLHEYDVRGYSYISLVFAGTSGGGSDTIDVYASCVTGN